MSILKFKYMSLILTLLMGFVFAPNVLTQENTEADRSEEAQQKVEDAESKTDAEIEEQKELQIPRSIADRAPDSIAEEIFRTEEIKKSIFEDDPFDIFIQPWRRINRKISEAIRLEFALAYTVLYQVATTATQGEQRNHAAGGIIDFSPSLQTAKVLPRIRLGNSMADPSSLQLVESSLARDRGLDSSLNALSA